MATISELNRSTEEKLDLAREKLKDINDILNEKLGSEKGRDMSSQRRRYHDLKRTLSINSNSINNRTKGEVLYHEEDEERDNGHPKLMSRVVSSKDNNNSGITKREQVIAIQSRQNDLERNKRIFGCLLGTLQKFRKEENILKSKEDKKAKIEKKLEEAEKLEKERLKEERDALLANRKRKQLEVKILETKMSKLKDLQVYEESHKHMSKYIKTETKPSIFWLPKVMTPETSELQNKTNQEIKEKIEERRQHVDEEIKGIESQIDKECEFNDDNHQNKKSSTKYNHSPDQAEIENGRERKREVEVKRKISRDSSSPEIANKKRICSQVVVKNKD